MQQHPQIIAVYLKFPTDLIFIFFFQEHAPQQLPVLLVHFTQNLAYQFAALSGGELRFGTGIRIGHIRSVFRHLRLAGVRAKQFERHVVTN